MSDKINWGRCNFATEDGKIVYCKGEHEKCERCETVQLTVSDVEFLASAYNRLLIVKQQLSNVDFNLSQASRENLPKDEWLMVIRSIIDSCG